MSQNAPATFQSKFQNNIEMVLNQQKPMLLDCVEVTDDASAEKIKVRDLVGNTPPQETDERHGDTKYSNTPHDGVWLGKPNELYFADLVDNADQLGTSIGLQGAYTMSGAGTVNRAIDRRVLEGIYGSIVSGKDGTVTTPFPSGQIIPVTTGGASGNQRLNVAKVRAAKLLLEQQFVDAQEDRYMVVTANQADDLLAEIQATSGDYTKAFAARYNEKGGLSGLLGFNFIQMELSNALLTPINVSPFSLDASGFRKNPFWVKSGIRLNFWQRLRTSIDKVPGKQLSTQIWAGTTCAATRTQAGKVGIILNSEA
jgi:hypothetical protein